MISFNDVKAQVIENMYNGVEFTYPQKAYVWYAYKGGNVMMFNTQKEALDYSSNVEKTQAEKEQYVQDQLRYNEQQRVIYDEYEAQVRAEFSELNDAEYAIIHSKAYEDGHAYGYDEVFMHMTDLVEMYQKLKKVQNV